MRLLIDEVDQGIPSQQNPAGRNIALLIFCAPTNRLSGLQQLVPADLAALEDILPGHVVRIS
jgi:hypothetical protein